MHPLLARQLRQVYGASPPPAGVDRLVDSVSDAYAEFDDERLMMDRAMSLASDELVAANERLKVDLARRLQIEDALRRSEERYALAMRGANDGIFDWDRDAGQIYLSDRWYAMLGLSRPPGENDMAVWTGRVHPDDADAVARVFDRMRAVSDVHVELEHRLRHADGQWLWVLMRACGVRDAAGRLTRVAGSVSDITARKRAEMQVQHAAHHDALTGLPNRALLLERLAAAMDRATALPRREFSLLFLDMDRFKVVNDSLGHNAGDQLLIQLARRVGETLNPGDTLARLGGDEFVVLLPNACVAEEAAIAGERIAEALKRPFDVEGHELFTTVSIGVAVSGPHYVDAHAMLRDADTALYRAKNDGPGDCRVFEQTMRHQAVRSLQLDSDLRRAIERQEFKMMYQPIVDLTARRLVGFEALIRWVHPERGLVSPGEFIPVAEKTGLMVPIGAWAMGEVCRQRGTWNDKFPGMRHASIAVNLSALQFAQADLVDLVRRSLDDGGLHPSQLTLEVTESAVMGNPEHVSRMFDQFKNMGVQLSIDDFGTGYSSLACLHRFAFDCLKIDRSFVARADKSPETFDIIETIVTLGHRLDLTVVAEGMETQAQLDCVVRAGCDRAQGYLFGRPVAADAAEAWMEQPVFGSTESELALTA